jgi:hypothetical protein
MSVFTTSLISFISGLLSALRSLFSGYILLDGRSGRAVAGNMRDRQQNNFHNKKRRK